MTENTDTVRYHSSDDMHGVGELAGITEPVAVVIRPDGSVDAYGYVAVIDQRPTPRHGQAVERRYVECSGGKYREHVVTVVPGRDGSATVYERTATGNGGPVFDGPAGLADSYARDRDSDLTARGFVRVADVRS